MSFINYRLYIAVASLSLVGCGGTSNSDKTRDAATPSRDSGVADAKAPSTPSQPTSAASPNASPDANLPTADTAPHTQALPTVALAPMADTIAQRLVFAPVMQRWFVAAARGKRLVVDLGRLDLELKKDSAHAHAFEQAAAARSPVAKGSRLRVRGEWGSEDATVSGFSLWNGRITAQLEVSPLVDSLARTRDPLIASVERASDSVATSVSSCDRSADSTLVPRLKSVAQTALDSLRAGDKPIYTRLQNSLRSRVSVVTGCFGTARGIAIASLYAGDYEWVRERVLLVGENGVTKRLTVRDLRFRAHEALQAVDADGDGIDDLAARAWAPRSGGTVLLTLRDGARLERLAAGFSWER